LTIEFAGLKLVAVAAAGALLASFALSACPAPAAAATVTPPDLKIIVPTGLVSIGTNSDTGDKQLQFTHRTSDVGTGPFEIDPTYNPQTGTSRFVQVIYNSPSPGVWNRDHTVPVAAIGVWHPPSDYAFPMTRFTLNAQGSNNSIGKVLATSPKVDYCITGDYQLSGIPNTPDQTSPPQSDCTDPTLPLGWSVGWADEYDQTDHGQPIDLTGIPDGTYILRATVDPYHALTESNVRNDITDTKLQISGDSVQVLSQTVPDVTPPSVSLTSPSPHAGLTGTVTLSASPSAASPATVTSVQFMLDGEPLGKPVTSPPYTLPWTARNAPVGAHFVSARVTDSTGNFGTAAPVPIVVVKITGRPAVVGGGQRPFVQIVNPSPGQVETGTVPLAAVATDEDGITSVRFSVDGKRVGRPVTKAPFAIRWSTTHARRGPHRVTALAIDDAGQTARATATMTVQNPPSPMTCFVLQAHANARGRGVVTTSAFNTVAPGETLLAFVSANGPAGGARQRAVVSGDGLRWRLVKRANSSPGGSDIWTATPRTFLDGIRVTSRLASPGFDQSLTVIAMEGTDGVGSSAGASGAGRQAGATLKTRERTSLVFAVGNDSARSAAVGLPLGWVPLDRWLDPGSGGTLWSQYTNWPTGPAGTVVRAPVPMAAGDRWNLAAVELAGDGE
jgi:hypothetical protein